MAIAVSPSFPAVALHSFYALVAASPSEYPSYLYSTPGRCPTPQPDSPGVPLPIPGVQVIIAAGVTASPSQPQSYVSPVVPAAEKTDVPAWLLPLFFSPGDLALHMSFGQYTPCSPHCHDLNYTAGWWLPSAPSFFPGRLFLHLSLTASLETVCLLIKNDPLPGRKKQKGRIFIQFYCKGYNAQSPSARVNPLSSRGPGSMA